MVDVFHGTTKATLSLALLAALAQCAPDIAQRPGPGPSVVVQFDPGAAVPVVPTPNDLAIDPSSHRIVVPAAPGDSAAQAEFNHDYLGTLGGFPFESTAAALVSASLAPSSVGPASVVGLDLTVGKSSPTKAPVALSPAYDDASRTIRIPPPNGGWKRAHQYAVALLAGPKGLRGAGGEPVIGLAHVGAGLEPEPARRLPKQQPGVLLLHARGRHHPLDPDRSGRPPRGPAPEGAHAGGDPPRLRSDPDAAAARDRPRPDPDPHPLDVHDRRRG